MLQGCGYVQQRYTLSSYLKLKDGWCCASGLEARHGGGGRKAAAETVLTTVQLWSVSLKGECVLLLASTKGPTRCSQTAGPTGSGEVLMSDHAWNMPLLMPSLLLLLLLWALRLLMPTSLQSSTSWQSSARTP